jgi:SAM-dependent methyltransferase
VKPLLSLLLAALPVFAQDSLVLKGGSGPGAGKNIVLVSGDEEYRSEEALPQLARILSTHHGFECTVLFAIDPADGTINPSKNDNIPGLEGLQKADLLILFTRFRDLPDGQMKHLVDYIESGRPIIGIRTATHAFQLKTSPTYSHYSWNYKEGEWAGGFGRRVLGETWINHHGKHGGESTRGILAAERKNHPILRGIADGDIWGPTDVYGVRIPLPGDSLPLVLGQVVAGMKPDDPPVGGPKNDPMMPVAWTRSYTGAASKTARVFTTTMGSSQDLANEGFRRLLVNATYWALGMEGAIPARAKVDIVGPYEPSPFKFNGHRTGVRPADLAAHGRHEHHVPQSAAQYASVIENPTRDAWQKPHEVLMALKLRPDETIADIGAGSGYFARRFAHHAGKVYAVDIDERLLEMVRSAGSGKIETVLAAEDNPKLPADSVDTVFICNVLHHIHNRGAYYRKLAAALRPGGRIVIVDFHKRPLPVGPPPGMKLTEEEVAGELRAAGFELAANHQFLPHQYFLEFRARLRR